ncbi:MAG: hypothetical protein V3T24_10120, partial [Longimicrobiales bacterium]
TGKNFNVRSRSHNRHTGLVRIHERECHSAEGTARSVVPEVALDPCGHAAPQGVRLGGLCEKGLEMVLDQRIERRQGGTAPAVDGPTVWCCGPKGRP